MPNAGRDCRTTPEQNAMRHRCGSFWKIRRLSASLDFVRPAIAGGLLLGLSIPIINAANLIFGAWILARGALGSPSDEATSAGASVTGMAPWRCAQRSCRRLCATLMLRPKDFVHRRLGALRQKTELQLNGTPDAPAAMRDLFLNSICRNFPDHRNVLVFLFGIFSCLRCSVEC